MATPTDHSTDDDLADRIEFLSLQGEAVEHGRDRVWSQVQGFKKDFVKASVIVYLCKTYMGRGPFTIQRIVDEMGDAASRTTIVNAVKELKELGLVFSNTNQKTHQHIYPLP